MNARQHWLEHKKNITPHATIRFVDRVHGAALCARHTLGAHAPAALRTRVLHLFLYLHSNGRRSCKRFNIDPSSKRKVYLCAIHKQGPLNEPLDCTKCAQYEVSHDDALAGCIVLDVGELPEDAASRSMSFEVEASK